MVWAQLRLPDLAGLAVVDLRAPSEPRVLVPRDRKMKITYQD